jgi:DNA-binding transcriptional regulator YdaS (Cro superfamily)
MDLKTFLKPLSKEERAAFAERAGTTLSYLHKIRSTKQKVGADLAINLVRESNGALSFEELSDADWDYVLKVAPEVGKAQSQ